MMKVYIAGAGGMLGEAVYKVFSKTCALKCTDKQVNAEWLDYCDFRDFEGYKASIESFEPELLVHLGAHTDLEYCERHPDDAYRTNTLAVEHAATLAQANGIKLVYISTAGVFDGRRPLYDDWDTPNPLGVYARSKYLGEQIVERRVEKHFVCRAGWMMGGGVQRDKKFVGKLMRQLAAGARRLKVVDDRLGTPTYTLDFARNLHTLVGTEYFGLYNMVCGGQAGRLEVAGELLRILGLEHEVIIEAVSSDYFADTYFAPRPAAECLINYKLTLRELNLMRDWQVALADYAGSTYGDFVRALGPLAVSVA